MLSVIEESSGRWAVRRDEAVMGQATLVTRPDRRRWLLLGDCAPEAYPPLLAAVPGEVSVTIDAADQRTRKLLDDNGFVVHRVDLGFRIPVDPARTGLAGTKTPPPGVTFLTAADADVNRLRHLDDVLRQDVPGTRGWRWDPEGFAAETFGADFDPATYLVAVDSASGDHIGLVRVWWPDSGPHLGLIGVTAARRRRGLARSLLSAAFAVVHARGHTHVTAEADATNTASITLLTGLGGERAGGSIELLRP